MSTDYAREKINSAIRALAVSKDPLKVRLYCAGHILNKINANTDLPANVKHLFTSIMDELQKYPATLDMNGQVVEDTIKVTTKKIRTKTASDLADKILELRSHMENEISDTRTQLK